MLANLFDIETIYQDLKMNCLYYEIPFQIDKDDLIKLLENNISVDYIENIQECIPDGYKYVSYMNKTSFKIKNVKLHIADIAASFLSILALDANSEPCAVLCVVGSFLITIFQKMKINLSEIEINIYLVSWLLNNESKEITVENIKKKLKKDLNVDICDRYIKSTLRSLCNYEILKKENGKIIILEELKENVEDIHY